MTELERLKVGPIEVTRCSVSQFVNTLVKRAALRGNPAQVVTANAQMFNLAEVAPSYRAILQKAQFVCADGVSITFAARVLMNATIPRIPGVWLLEKLADEARRDDLSIYLLGGKPGSAAMTSAILNERYPGIRMVGVACPPMNFQNDEQQLLVALEDVRQASPNILFVGLGVPKQEHFIHHHIAPLQVPLSIGVGGSFELISMHLPRAPILMQRIGLEWLFRLWQEPRRLWRRYLIGNVSFLWILGGYWIRSRMLYANADDSGSKK